MADRVTRTLTHNYTQHKRTAARNEYPAMETSTEQKPLAIEAQNQTVRNRKGEPVTRTGRKSYQTIPPQTIRMTACAGRTPRVATVRSIR